MSKDGKKEGRKTQGGRQDLSMDEGDELADISMLFEDDLGESTSQPKGPTRRVRGEIAISAFRESESSQK